MKKIYIDTLSESELTEYKEQILKEMIKISAEKHIDLEDAYQQYLKREDSIHLIETPKSYWHSELPQYYVVEGDPKQIYKMNEYAEKGIRRVEILEADEYEYLKKKERQKLIKKMERTPFTRDEVTPELEAKCKELGIELKIMSEEECMEQMILNWLDDIRGIG